MSELRSVHVWDRGTRLFHWINGFCVLGLMGVGFLILNASALDASNEGKRLLKTIHVWIGYVFVINLAWRLVWGFIGSETARWKAILPGGRGYLGELREYLSALFGSKPQPHGGHNPAGRLAVAAMLLVLLSQGITGIFIAGTDIFYPPFGNMIAQWVAAPGVDPATLQPYAPETYNPETYKEMRSIRGPIADVHKWGFYTLVVLVALHLIGVVVTEIRERSGIVSAMITGKKTLYRAESDTENR